MACLEGRNSTIELHPQTGAEAAEANHHTSGAVSG